MKKEYLLILVFFLKTFFTLSQTKEPKTIENIYGFQIGFVGAWGYYEAVLQDNFTLKTELGIDGSYSYSSADIPKSQYTFLPSISLEPRWYYNIEKRQKLGKSVENNTGNFFGLKTTYNPSSLFTITNSINSFDSSIIRFIPSWGLRRSLGNSFDFELRLGAGYVSTKSINNQEQGFIFDFSIRLGYIFK